MAVLPVVRKSRKVHRGVARSVAVAWDSGLGVGGRVGALACPNLPH